MLDVTRKSLQTSNESIQDTDHAVAMYIHQTETRLSRLIRTQFLFMSLTTIASVALLVGVFSLITTFTRAPVNVALLDQIEESNRQLSAITRSILQPTPGITTTRALELVLAQAEIHQKAVEELRRTQQQPIPEAQSLLQIVGSAAVLALLGVLGLQRLQNIDAEINNLRESVYTQIESRAKDLREILGAAIDEQVDQVMEKTREDIESLTKQAAATLQEYQQQVRDMLSGVQQQVNGLRNDVRAVEEMLDQYPWLKSKEKFEKGVMITQLSSVEQAHRLAVEFNAAGDYSSAKEALREIIRKNLPGDANDFHNAYIEAMRMEELTLALEIVELGLRNYPYQFDLMADKASVLQSLGRAAEARALLEDWYRQKPEEFARSWRPMVFYTNIFDVLELTSDAIETIKSMFNQVTKTRPFEIKPWSAYARFLIDQGHIEEAEDILNEALKWNPLSQELNYVLGELLLRQGKVKEALTYLQNAFRVDYQPQYQPDVNPYALRATLAQAYEACGELDKAELLYRSIVIATGRSATRTIKEYAEKRLEVIALLRGKLPEQESEDSGKVLELLKAMIQDAQGYSTTPESPHQE